MEIRASYSLTYLHNQAPDPLVAASEDYVEIAEEGSPFTFDALYSINICTIGYIERHLQTNSCFSSSGVLVVKRYDTEEVLEALESILPEIDKIGVRIE